MSETVRVRIPIFVRKGRKGIEWKAFGTNLATEFESRTWASIVNGQLHWIEADVPAPAVPQAIEGTLIDD